LKGDFAAKEVERWLSYFVWCFLFTLTKEKGPLICVHWESVTKCLKVSEREPASLGLRIKHTSYGKKIEW